MRRKKGKDVGETVEERRVKEEMEGGRERGRGFVLRQDESFISKNLLDSSQLAGVLAGTDLFLGTSVSSFTVSIIIIRYVCTTYNHELHNPKVSKPGRT